MMINDAYIIMAGWWYTYPSEKYEFVSSDHYPIYEMENKIHVPNHQPENLWNATVKTVHHGCSITCIEPKIT